MFDPIKYIISINYYVIHSHDGAWRYEGFTVTDPNGRVRATFNCGDPALDHELILAWMARMQKAIGRIDLIHDDTIDSFVTDIPGWVRDRYGIVINDPNYSGDEWYRIYFD